MKQTKGKKIKVCCKNCYREFDVRLADRNRGWGKYCSKACKANEQAGSYDRNLRKKMQTWYKKQQLDIELALNKNQKILRNIEIGF